jgi:hypothetical protein
MLSRRQRSLGKSRMDIHKNARLLTSGNTNAPSMIGEKAARMMLASTDQAIAA